MIQVQWTDPAVSDLRNIVDYIARDSALYAEAMIERIITACLAMAAFPQRGRIVPEVSNSKIREIIINPYRVIYRIKRNHLEILAVIHGAQNIGGMNPKLWK